MSASNEDGGLSPLKNNKNIFDEIAFPLDDNFNKLSGNNEDNLFFSNSQKGKINNDFNNLLPLYYFDDNIKNKKNDKEYEPNGQNDFFGRNIHEQMQSKIQKQQQYQSQSQSQSQQQLNLQPQQSPSPLHLTSQQSFGQFDQDQSSLNQFFNQNKQHKENKHCNNLFSSYKNNPHNGMNELSSNLSNLSNENNHYGFQNSSIQQQQSTNEFQSNTKMLGQNQKVNGFNIGEAFLSNQKPSKKSKVSSKNFIEYSNEELIEKARAIASEQNGCRFIQKKIETEPELGNSIFESLEKDLLSLSCDSFGNYLLQKLLTVIDEDKIERFVDIITPFFVKVSISSHGTRVVQKLLDSIQENPELISKITYVIENNLLELTTDSNSNHIIIKYVTVVHFPMNKLVYDSVIDNFLKISKDKFGCCVMQKCIELGSPDQKKALIILTLQNVSLLITHQFGNYVLQFIVSLRNQEIISSIIQMVIPNIRKYCVQKFGSNVLEKCLDSSCQELQLMLINSIVQNEGLIADLIIDPFGNYIIQKILLLTKGKTYYSLLQIISKNADKIKKVSFGNKVLSKLMNTHKDLCFMINTQSMNQMIPQIGMNPVYFQQPQQGQYGYNINMPNQPIGMEFHPPQMNGYYEMRQGQNIRMPLNYQNNPNYFMNQNINCFDSNNNANTNTHTNKGNMKKYKGMK